MYRGTATGGSGRSRPKHPARTTPAGHVAKIATKVPRHHSIPGRASSSACRRVSEPNVVRHSNPCDSLQAKGASGSFVEDTQKMSPPDNGTASERQHHRVPKAGCNTAATVKRRRKSLPRQWCPPAEDWVTDEGKRQRRRTSCSDGISHGPMSPATTNSATLSLSTSSAAAGECTSPPVAIQGGVIDETLQLCNVSPEDRFMFHLAVVTLYRDQIRPQESEIKHRLVELHSSALLEKQFLNLASFLSEQYIVQRSEGSVTVFLRKTPAWFQGWVDVRDTRDPYPPLLWVAFRSWLTEKLRATGGGLGNNDAETCRVGGRGGRYGLSKKIKTLGPPEFRKYSLGQVCHIVQLAVHQGMLTYDGGALMPAVCCSCVVRRLFPPSGDGGVSSDVVGKKEVLDESACAAASDLQEVLAGLRLLFETDDNDPPRPMLLSQLKLRYLHRLHQRLDPAFFGFTRLSDFIAEKCGTVCRLVREGGRQVLVDRVPPPSPESPLRQPSSSSSSDLPVSGTPAEAEAAAACLSPHLSEIVSHVPEKQHPWEGQQQQQQRPLPHQPAPHERTAGSLLNIVARHARFHSSLSFAYGQFLSEEYKKDEFANFKSGEGNPANLEAAGRFLDSLFADVLRPSATTLPQPSVDDVFQIRWFSRQPLIERQLTVAGYAPLRAEDTACLAQTFHAVLPARGVSCGVSDDCARIVRPSKLRRLITAKIAKLKSEYFRKDGKGATSPQGPRNGIGPAPIGGNKHRIPHDHHHHHHHHHTHPHETTPDLRLPYCDTRLESLCRIPAGPAGTRQTIGDGYSDGYHAWLSQRL